MRTLLFNCNVILPDEIRPGWVAVEAGRIAQVGFGPAEVPADRAVDLGGRYLAPGFVELHSHGAGGADFMDGTVEAFKTACDTLLRHGTTTLLPTTLAASPEEICRSIDAFRAAKEVLWENTLNLHGLHMEGPYLNVDQCGAIDPKYIRDPDPAEYEAFLDYGRGVIKRWTLAVERPGAERFADALLREGVLPSLGHSNAEYSQVVPAFEHGVTHVTHLYSSMSTITRHSGFRHSGVLESAFCIPDMTVEIIADGCHLPVELLNMVWRLKGVDRVALTCDSMRCAGQDVTESILGSLENGQRVIIEDGVAKLPDRMSFAGSIATDDRLVRVMAQKAGVPLHEAVRMMSLTPANIIGIGDRTGSIEVGKDADLVCFDDEINVSGVMVRGRGLIGVMKE